MNSLDNGMHNLLSYLATQYPTLSFREAKTFYWSPQTREIGYKPQGADDSQWSWRLLHETGHALLQHTSYSSDFELVELEVAAWDKANELASVLGIQINENYTQDCLDTYRDWLHKRSSCPACGIHSLQTTPTTYQCFNCQMTWHVSASRFCRAYRTVSGVK